MAAEPQDTEIEHRSAPRWAWAIFDNCLEGENPDSEDYEDIQRALQSMNFGAPD